MAQTVAFFLERLDPTVVCREDELLVRCPVELREHGARGSGSLHPRRIAANELRIVVHEYLLLVLGDEAVAGTTVRRHDNPNPHAVALLVRSVAFT